jgi:hypothetical protein
MRIETSEIVIKQQLEEIASIFVMNSNLPEMLRILDMEMF